MLDTSLRVPELSHVCAAESFWRSNGPGKTSAAAAGEVDLDDVELAPISQEELPVEPHPERPPLLLELSARHWLSLMQAGDEAGLRCLYASCRGRVFSCALAIVRRDDIANEVVSTCFMQVWTNASRFDPSRGGVLAWLTMIARSRALDALRRMSILRLHEVCVDDEESREALTAVSEEPPFLYLERRARDRGLQRAMARLSSIQRQVVCLTSIDGFSHEEASRHLNLPLGTVKSHARRGLAVLKRRCEAAGMSAA